MCASYGLEAGDRRGRPFRLPPLDEPVNQARLFEWLETNRGQARITGRNALNLNPVIAAPTGERRLEFGWWWLHVGGQPAPYSAFNSRDDRLMASWRRPFQHRALLPASWYVERGSRFELPGAPVFALAAITTRVPQDDGGELVTYSLVTRDAVAEASTVHSRMPLILPPEIHDTWLDPERPGDGDLVIEAVASSEDLSREARVVGGRRRPAEAPTLF